MKDAFRSAGIVGEENNVLVAYLSCVSRLCEKPLAVIVQSPNAAGKTTLMDAVLAFFPDEARVKYSALTGQALYYLGETKLRHKILAIVEEAGAEKAACALKLLQSEGELTIASTGKDPATGRMVTQEYHVEGPVMILLTTTAIDIDEELQNRCLTLAVDETAEQTARIQQKQREKRTLAGLAAKAGRAETLRVLRNAQRLLEPVEVLNLYAPSLTFPSLRTRNRRDHEKYLTLIDAIALLHQRQRPRGRHEMDGRSFEYVTVSREDIALAGGRDETRPRKLPAVAVAVCARQRQAAVGPNPAGAAQLGAAVPRLGLPRESPPRQPGSRPRTPAKTAAVLARGARLGGGSRRPRRAGRARSVGRARPRGPGGFFYSCFRRASTSIRPDRCARAGTCGCS